MLLFLPPLPLPQQSCDAHEQNYSDNYPGYNVHCLPHRIDFLNSLPRVGFKEPYSTNTLTRWAMLFPIPWAFQNWPTGCTFSWVSVARTDSVCHPGTAFQSKDHDRHAKVETCSPRVPRTKLIHRRR